MSLKRKTEKLSGLDAILFRTMRQPLWYTSPIPSLPPSLYEPLPLWIYGIIGSTQFGRSVGVVPRSVYSLSRTHKVVLTQGTSDVGVECTSRLLGGSTRVSRVTLSRDLTRSPKVTEVDGFQKTRPSFVPRRVT